MSTPQSHADTAALDRELNQAILAGNILNAFETYYADDVVMQENDLPPFAGKAVNRKREEDFVNSVQEFKNGTRTKLQQVASRRWKNGQISHERFYYKGQ